MTDRHEGESDILGVKSVGDRYVQRAELLASKQCTGGTEIDKVTS